MNIILLGPPGSGKGTQTQRLCAQFGFQVIATGDLVRKEITAGSDIGRQIESEVNAGRFPDDSVILGLVSQTMSRQEVTAVGFIFDGMPRTLAQAEALDAMMKSRGDQIDGVIEFKVDEEAMVERMLSRLTCPSCSASYSEANPSKVAGQCDRCGATLVRRKDDTRDAIVERMRVYHEKTEPLIAYYSHQGKIVSLDGMESVEKVAKAIDDALEKFKNSGAK
ncbi:MAG: adenylate kinase [Holosporales bacterium]